MAAEVKVVPTNPGSNQPTPGPLDVCLRPYKQRLRTEGKKGEERTVIEFYCMNQESETCLLRVPDFTPFIYFELPTDIQWNTEKAAAIGDWFRRKMPNAVSKVFLKPGKKLYYYRGEKEYPFLLVSFFTEESIRHAINLVKKSEVPYAGSRLVPREHKVPSILKLFAVRKLRFSSWIFFPNKETPADKKISTFKHEYEASFRSLNPVPLEICSSWRTLPTILSIDVEQFSSRENAFPDSKLPSDVILVISGTYEDTKTGKTSKFSIGRIKAEGMADCEYIERKDDKGIVHAFNKKVFELDPTVVLGYNLFDYDFPTCIDRLEFKGDEWESCGRFPDRKDVAVSYTWESSAYGKNEIRYMDMWGRLCLDVLPFVKRDYKLDNYRLDTVAKHFIGKGKSPLEIKDMFRLYRIAVDTELPKLLDSLLRKPCTGVITKLVTGPYKMYTEKEISEALRLAERLEKAQASFLRVSKASVGVEEKKEEVVSVQEAKDDLCRYYDRMRVTLFSYISNYCTIDTVLPLEVFKKLEGWVGLVELSVVVCAEIEDLTTRGQGIRVFAQLYLRAYAEGYVIDTRENPPDVPYTGGYCFDPTPGIYWNVITLDFSSLYPSEIMASNIDYTTFVPEGVDIPDDDCYVLEWYDDPGARERKQNKKKKAKKSTRTIIMLEKRRYRFFKHKRGLLPTLLQEIVGSRKKVKLQLADEKDPRMKVVLNSRQNAMKTCANSAYGMYGAKKGRAPFLEGAVCVTAMGRKHILQASGRIQDKYADYDARVIYGDTDSGMVQVNVKGRIISFEGNIVIAPAEHKFSENNTGLVINKLGKEMSVNVSTIFPPPLIMEFEKGFKVFFILSAKMYGGFLYKGDGSVDYEKMFSRGIITSRRDNCPYLKKVFKQAFKEICMGLPSSRIREFYYESVINLMQRKIPMSELRIVKAVGQEYKNEENPLAILSVRMKEMGKPVRAGDRIDYVFVQGQGVEEKKQGYRILPPELVVEQGFVVDTLYTFEKQLVTPLDKILKLGYKDEYEGTPPRQMPLAVFHRHLARRRLMLPEIIKASEEFWRKKNSKAKKPRRRVVILE